MKWVVLSIFTLLCWIGVYLYFHLGVSKPVEVAEFQASEQLIVYKAHLGAYHKIVNVIKEVEDELGKLNLICSQTFGLYLDDPNVVDEDRLTSHGGCIFEGATEGLKERIQETSLKTDVLPARKTVRADFSGSPAIGPMKVYPKVNEFIQKHRLRSAGPMLEIYSVNGENVTTTYLQPVN